MQTRLPPSLAALPLRNGGNRYTGAAMSAFIKGKLKSLKEALGAKDWTLVEKLASDVLSFESGNYNARVFRSLALFNLERFDEAEESYKKAIEISPSQPLARQGLASYYEKRQRWSDFAWSLLELMQLFVEADESVKYAETLQKLIDVRRSQGTRPELISALSYLLPSSPSISLLSKLPPPNPTSPTASTVHAIQLALQSYLPTLLEVVTLVEAEESNLIETEIKKRRQRLGGQTLSAVETRKQVEGDYLARSQLVGLYQAVLDDPDASEKEELRRSVEHKLLVHLRTLLAALPSSFDPPTLNLAAVSKRKEVLQAEEQDKGGIRAQVENLAKGLVVIRSREEEAWHVVLEWADRYAEWDRIDWRELAIFVELFPNTGLSKIASASAARHHASTRTEDDEEPATAAPNSDEMVTIIESGLEASPDSLLAHLLAVHFFAGEKEWEAVVQISEAGLGVLARMEAECGRASPRSRVTLDRHLSIALVHHNPPTNHLRALRLIESLLSSATVDTSLLTAKAYVLQSSEQWDKSIAVWDAVLASSDLDESVRLEVQGERGWCLFEAGSFAAAVEGINAVVEAFEARKVVRDEEMKVKQKIRSKAGIELEEGVQEGETTNESEQRAKAWWRLGKCLWELGVTDATCNTKSYTAFVSSIRASSHYAPAFTSLGLYYRDLSPPDPERALKCFQKAFELNGSEEVAARYLAEEFAESGDWDLVEIIARRVVDGNRGSVFGGKVAVRLAWAWKAIGGAELNSKKYPQAIVAFQSALRGAPDDVHTWIRLGVAYRASGKHVASLKVFAKALSIDPTSWYAKFSIGDVQREIGLLESAVKTFREILVERPEELGVLVVLSETLLASGVEEMKGGSTARAEESFVAALEMAERIIGAGLATRVAWKVAGDALGGLAGIAELSKGDEATTIGLRLLSILGEEKVDVKIEGMDAVTAESLTAGFDGVGSAVFFAGLQVLAFKMRILLETENDSSIGSAWLDLGLAISRLHPAVDSTTTDEAQHQSIRCLKFALQLEPLNSLFWNALGVLSFTLSPRLSQHALIKSIEHSPRAAVPWTNLGFFYLSHEEEELANMAFLKAQVLDPDYEAAWAGQAILADRAGEGVVAAGLWSHAFSLPGSCAEADVGFAISSFAQHRATASTSTAGSTTEALSAPLFALTRYLSASPRDFHALHLQSLILEQIDDLPSSSTALELAASILEEIYEEDESPLVEARFIIAQSNLGRVRLAMEDWEGAKVAFEMGLSLLNLDELDRSSAPSDPAAGVLTRSQSIMLFTACKLGMGIAHYSLGEMEAAIEVWNGALEDLDTFDGAREGAVGRRADLDVALGKLYWSRGEEDLAISSFLDSPNVIGDRTPLLVQMTIHAAGIVTADRTILASAKRNAERLTDDRCTDSVNRMKIRAALVQNDPQGAVAALTRAVHSSPGNISLRLQLLSLLLKISANDDSTDSTRTNLITPSLDIAENTPLNERVEMLVCVAVEAFLSSDRATGERALHKAIFLSPSDEGLRRKLARVKDLDI